MKYTEEELLDELGVKIDSYSNYLLIVQAMQIFSEQKVKERNYEIEKWISENVYEGHIWENQLLQFLYN